MLYPIEAVEEAEESEAEEILPYAPDDGRDPRPTAANGSMASSSTRTKLILTALGIVVFIVVLGISLHTVGCHLVKGSICNWIGKASTETHRSKILLCGDAPQELLIAATDGDIDGVKCLINHRADVNFRERNDYMGYTVLAQAAASGHVQIVHMLLEHRAQIDTSDKKGETALSGAAWQGNPKMVEFLLESKATVDVTNKHGETPLFEAASAFTNFDVIKLLIKYKADVNKHNNEGHSILAAAHWNKDVEMLLQKHGAQCSPKDWNASCVQKSDASRFLANFFFAVLLARMCCGTQPLKFSTE